MKYKLLAVAVLMAVVFCFSGSVKALTSEEISTQIEALQAQIVQLQAQLAQLQSQSATPETPTPTTTSSWCHDFNINMKAGATGDEVVALQTALTKEGYDISSDRSGNFSHATYAAVASFQENYYGEILTPYGLTKGTGAVSGNTRIKLNALYGCAKTITREQAQINAASAKFISVISPKGDEQWQIGQTYTIAWTSKGLDEVNISIIGINKTNKALATTIATKVLASDGNYLWKVPNTFTELLFQKDKYRVQISSIDGKTKATSFNYFSITATATTAVECKPGQIIGDLNGDGLVTSADATLAANISVGTIAKPANICCADVTADGIIGSIDAAMITRIANGLQQSPGKCPAITTTPTITRIAALAAEDSQVYAGEKFSIEGTNFVAPDTVTVAGKSAVVTQEATYMQNGKMLLWAMAPNDLKNGDGYVVVKNANGTSNSFWVATFASISTPPATVTCNPGQIIGDLNGDGLVTSADATLAASISVGTIAKPANICCADVTADGIIGSIDAAMITRIANGLQQSPGKCPAAQPSITVTSPNGGETWKIGETHQIKWTGTNIPSNGAITIAMHGTSVANNYYLFTEIGNLQSVNWTIPNTIAPDQYKMRIFCGEKGSERYCSPDGSRASNPNAEDYGDNYFTISAATTYGLDILNSIKISSDSVKFNFSRNPSTCLQIKNSQGVYFALNSYYSSYSCANSTLIKGYEIEFSVPKNNFSLPITEGEYYQVCNYDTTGNHACSRPIKAETQPSITVTYPMGNEMLEKGKGIYIGWQSSGFLSTDKLDIELYKGDGNNGYIVRSIPISQGSYYWIVSERTSDWGLGINKKQDGIVLAAAPISELYKIKILAYHNNEPTIGESGYFGIKLTSNPVCSDSDGGKNYYIKGRIDYTTVAGINGNISDECYDSQYLQEYYCDTSSGDNYKSEKYNCPNGCENGACKQAAQPSITVTSPNGGESWTVGSAQNITWTASNLPNGSYDRFLVSVTDFSGGAVEYSIATLLPSQRSYSWTIPASTTSGNITPGSKFKIRVVYLALVGSNAEDYSDNYFTISAATPSCTGYSNNSVVLNSMQAGSGTVSFNLTNTTSSAQSVSVSIGSGSVSQSAIVVPSGACAIPTSITYSASVNTTITFTYSGQIIASLSVSPSSTTQPSITVTSPNGGEQWAQSSTHYIAWNTQGGSVSAVDIKVYSKICINQATGQVVCPSYQPMVVISGAPASGSYQWKVGKAYGVDNFVNPGSYYLEVCVAGTAVCDKSNNYFDITASLGQSVLDDQLASIANALASIARQVQDLLKQ